MKALIETTAQINRIFKSKKKAEINEFMKENECYSGQNGKSVEML